MLNGNIFDVYLDNKKNKIITWIINNNGAVRIEDNYEPSFYVYSNSMNLHKLATILHDLPQIKKINFTYRKTDLGSAAKKLVLEIFPKKICLIGKLSKMIDFWGKFHKYHLFNVDIRLPSRYLQDKGVFCNSNVRWDGKQFILDDSQWNIDYIMPFYRSVYLDIIQKKQSGIISFDNPIKSIVFDDFVIEEENEADTILSAIEHVQKIDPDIIYINKGDSSVIPFLYHRAKICGISNLVNLGREKTQSLRPFKQEKTYFSYGQIIYRPAFYTLYGRAHIDTSNSFLYGESGFHGLLDISRCSNIPLQLLSRLGAGTAISQMQVNKATEEGYLIPWKKNMPETWKTARELLVSDRGGLILDPAVGLHEDVIELDFASLYPNVMVIHNISPETILCDCCKDSHNRVPHLDYHICIRQKGLIPEVLKSIISRRFCFKARSKNKNFDKDMYNEIQQAWKWVLLVCFGYTGYRNARFGRIECYESITAFSRDILLIAKETVEQAGYKVLHGIIDSLWIKASNESMKPLHLSRMIGERTGIGIDVEGQYKWIVFLPSKVTEVGALNRYYGVFNNGELKVRGIELRQSNSPYYLKNMQRDMLKILSKANNTKEFIDMIPFAIDVLLEYGKQIIELNVDNKTLIFTTRISKDITQYRVNNLVKSALIQLRNAGIQTRPGQSIRYIVRNEKSRDHNERVRIAEKIDENEKVDVNYYLRQIAKCGESILIPFGYKLERLYNILQKI